MSRSDSSQEPIPLSVVDVEEFPVKKTHNVEPGACSDCPLGELRGNKLNPLQCVGRVTLNTVVRFNEHLNPIGGGALLVGGNLAESSGEANYTTEICGVGLGPLTPGSTVRRTLDLAATKVAQEFAAEPLTGGEFGSAPPHDIEIVTSTRMPHASPDGVQGRLHYDNVGDINAEVQVENLLLEDAVRRSAKGIELYHGY